MARYHKGRKRRPCNCLGISPATIFLWNRIFSKIFFNYRHATYKANSQLSVQTKQNWLNAALLQKKDRCVICGCSKHQSSLKLASPETRHTQVAHGSDCEHCRSLAEQSWSGQKNHPGKYCPQSFNKKRTGTRRSLRSRLHTARGYWRLLTASSRLNGILLLLKTATHSGTFKNGTAVQNF